MSIIHANTIRRIKNEDINTRKKEAIAYIQLRIKNTNLFDMNGYIVNYIECEFDLQYINYESILDIAAQFTIAGYKVLTDKDLYSAHMFIYWG